MAVSTARWRCRPAANTPSASAIGSWTSHEATTRTPVRSRAASADESWMNCCQFASPLNWIAEDPFQEQKLSKTAKTMGSTTNPANKATGGRRNHAGHQPRIRRGLLPAVGVTCLPTSVLSHDRVHRADELLRAHCLVEQLTDVGQHRRDHRARQVLVPVGLEGRCRGPDVIEPLQ